MRALLAVTLLVLATPAVADEGMWLFNAPPREQVKRDYGFELTDAWLARAMRSAVRFNNGGSGAFVSPNGLVVTNHHIGADALQKLSGPGRDLVAQGYYAATPADELPCPDTELNVLLSIQDVTDRVEAAVRPGMAPEEAAQARTGVMAAIEKESLDQTGLRSDVVTLYQGGAYHLYRFKKYTDVRLVMAPEQEIAFFGGDVHNFEYPRYNLDVAFFRVYQDGQPAHTPDFLRWSAAGPRDGELVFVVGNPGRTNRLDTCDRLLHLRDLTLPFRLLRLRHAEALLQQYSQSSPEAARQAQADLYSVANARKAYAGQFQGLLDARIMDRKRRLEAAFKARLSGDPAAAAFDQIRQCELKLAGFEKEYALFEQGWALDSELFGIARHLVRLSVERARPNQERMREYRDSNLESLELELYSPAPIAPELEKVRLTGALSLAAEVLGGDHPVVTLLLEGRTPEARAAELVAGTRLNDPAERRRLAAADLSRETDPMIRLALRIDPVARELRKRFEVEVEEPERKAYALIARARFALAGAAEAPDATFSLRLAYGRVGGYLAEGRQIPWHTTFRGAFELAAQHDNRSPFRLPARWLEGRSRLDLDTPFDFVSTADTIGGNSGSPVINRNLELVGVNFDRNRYGLVRNFVYTDEQARHIAVHSAAVLEALRKLYGAERLLRELSSI
ncbi:MAG: S46 family peptidase [Candidatus Eremiobacterota bacterium]